MRTLRLSVLCFLGACATASKVSAPTPAGGSAASSSSSPRWKPSPEAAAALAQVHAAAPFAAPAAALAQASGGAVPTNQDSETLLYERSVTLDDRGAAVEVSHSLWRILTDEPDQTLSFTWAPWRQSRPAIRARVVDTSGQESWLDPATIVEGSVAYDDLQLSDVRRLTFPLPNARKGSVVELQLTYTATKPLLDGAGMTESWDLWSRAPVRRMRFVVDVPERTPLTYDVVGVDRPAVAKAGGRQRLVVDVPELPFRPFELTLPKFRAQAPRFGWSTAASWAQVAERYRALIEPAFDDAPDVDALVSRLDAKPTVAEKLQEAVRWVGGRVRYTAVHLGQGAIMPTKPSVTLKRGYGDCKDLSVLVVSALRKAGVAADVALVHSSGFVPQDGLPGLEAFNHMIVVAPQKQGGLVWADATAPNYPVGALPPVVREQRALIITKGADKLTSTPSRAQTLLQSDETFDLVLAPFGAGRGTYTDVRKGSSEGYSRGFVQACDGKAAKGLADGPVKSLFGDVPFTASVTGCELSEPGPFVVKAVVDQAHLDTGDREAAVKLPALALLSESLPDWLFGERPGADQGTPEQRAQRAQEVLEETGFTQAQLDRRAYSMDAALAVSRTYRLTLPPRFDVGPLPKDRTLQLGLGTWTESYARPDPRTVVVRFAFESMPVDWTAEDVVAFREAAWRRFDENVLVLKALFEPIRLLEDKKPVEAMALARQWLKETPKEAPTRARFARMLSSLGLVDVAQREVERALADGPDDPLVLMVCGDLARRNAFGLTFEPPFDRAKAISCLAKAHEKLPDHSWPVLVLADVLRRNEQGELERWNPDVERATVLLEELLARGEDAESIVEMLSETYLRASKVDALKKLFERERSSKDLSTTEAAVADTLLLGVDGVLQRIERAQSPKDQLTQLVMAFSTFAELGRFDDARVVLDRFKGSPQVEAELKPLRAMRDATKPVPDRVDVATPEAAARTVVAQLLHGSSATDIGRRLSALASPAGKKELDGTAAFFTYARLPSLSVRFPFVQVFHRASCVTTGSATTFRVRCEAPENRKFLLTSYWVKGARGFELESMGSPGQLGRRAWDAVEQGRLADAAAWLDWAADEGVARGASRANLLKDVWSQAKREDPKALRFGAALAQVLFNDTARAAPPAVLAALEQGRTALSGALRRRADGVMASVYEARHDYAKALATLTPLAQSENEPGLWRWHASLQSQAGKLKDALARIDQALTDNPGDDDWRQLKATVLLRANRAADAFAVLQQLQQEKGQAVDVRNNLLWAQTLAGKLDDAAEREARALAGEDDVRQAELHTVATVLLARGRASEAAELGLKRQGMLTDGPDDAQWLFRAQLLALLGFDDDAKAAVAKMKEGDPELDAEAKKVVAGKR